MEIKNLHLFTSSFPYRGTSENSFIYPELKFLASKFDHVYIYPFQRHLSRDYVKLPSNVTVVYINVSKQIKLPFTENLYVFRVVVEEILKRPSLVFKISQIRELFSFFKMYLMGAKHISMYFKDKNVNDDVFYTYWFENWNYMLSIWKEYFKNQNIKLISKTHGFDLYDERNRLGFIPFRYLQFRNTNKVFAISKMGETYLKTRNSRYAKKINSSYLGTFDKGVNNSKYSDEIKLVSCSSVSKVKRVHLIVESLKLVKGKVKWVHFGNGDLFEDLKIKIKELPKNISVELKGFVENEKVIAYYQNNPINLFVNVSESEGIPVSIMEALSFGIPIVATNVGGVSEVVPDNVGILLKKDFNPNELAEILNSFPNNFLFSKESRDNARVFWQNTFEANQNYTSFVEKLYY